MKRLLQISLDVLLTSALPIVMWIVLGIVVRSEVASVFSLTYPIQFVWLILVNLFAVGPNITARKLKDRNVVMTNLIMGIVVGGVLTIFLCVNVDAYIIMMNLDPVAYHDFVFYGMVWLYISFIAQIISQKLYYVGKNNSSNIMNLFLNGVNFLMIVGFNLMMSEWNAITLTLVFDAAIIIAFLLKNFEKRKFSLRFLQNIKNTSFNILDYLGLLLAYGFGFMNSFSYGEIFVVAITFDTLTTDAQWDVLIHSVGTTAEIDISKGRFVYRKSLKNAYKLLAILIGSVLVMDALLYSYYRPELWVFLVILAIGVITMILEPLVEYRWKYLQIENNKIEHNVVVFGVRVIRVLISFLPTAFCTYIGQTFEVASELIYTSIKCRKFKVFQRGKTLNRLRGR
ncbi:hypothetical protein IKF34_02960 [Candidatus Saccharibacteria bacterium]|nr:hypothetical protein [Candidatus Saccharibacteria bacterium]